jgi:hypothetical protein
MGGFFTRFLICGAFLRRIAGFVPLLFQGGTKSRAVTYVITIDRFPEFPVPPLERV